VDKAALDRLLPTRRSNLQDEILSGCVTSSKTLPATCAGREESSSPENWNIPQVPPADGWEAALKAIQGFLNLARLRLADRPGHHLAALNALAALLDDDDHKAQIRRLRELRRARRSGVYEVGPPPDVEALNASLNAAEDLLAELTKAVDRYLSS